jgi:hypothetical protein
MAATISLKGRFFCEVYRSSPCRSWWSVADLPTLVRDVYPPPHYPSSIPLLFLYRIFRVSEQLRWFLFEL